MIIISNAEALTSVVNGMHQEGLSIGYTPTMGALHEGHFDLVSRSIEENDVSICSIFVNPTQFNESSDLEKYPRTLTADSQGLEKIGCDILFAPAAEAIYPDGSDYKVEVELGGLDRLMEGAHRPGHFEGVVQVVNRLIELTQCDRLYMGQKDFQQFTIIQRMIDNLGINTELVVCDIVRGKDGLALSSRNKRLTDHFRTIAPIIHETLVKAKESINDLPVQVIEKTALSDLSTAGLSPEYFDIINGKTLETITEKDQADLIVACTAVWAGDVRLIDNMVLIGSINTTS